MADRRSLLRTLPADDAKRRGLLNDDRLVKTLLLAALAPVSYFLARVLEKPDRTSLHEYPWFLGLNVGFIALAGVLALVREVRQFPREEAWPKRSRLLTLAGWLAPRSASSLGCERSG